MELERDGREEATESLKGLQAQLDIKKEAITAAFHQHEATKNQVSELEKETKDLRGFIPTIETEAVENFCSLGGHFAKICDAYIAGFFKA